MQERDKATITKEWEIPGTERWEQDFQSATAILASAAADIWETEAKESEVPQEAIEETKKGLKAALMKAMAPIQKAFQGIWKAFKDTCSKIKVFVMNPKGKPGARQAYIKAACDKLFHKVKLEAKKTVEAIVAMSKNTGIKLAEAGKFVLAAPGKALENMQAAGKAMAQIARDRLGRGSVTL
jgi:hypothetical protein